MARGINKVIIVGNLGGDPDLRFTPNGNAVINFTVATSESWKDKVTGQKQERTEWHKIVIFNQLAEIAGKYLKKGSKVYIEGSLRTRSWEQEGVKRYSTEIVASEMQMLDKQEQYSDASGSSQNYQQGSMGGQNQNQNQNQNQQQQNNYNQRQQQKPTQQNQQQGGMQNQNQPQKPPQRNQQQGGMQNQQQNNQQQPNPNQFDNFDDDIPF